MTTAYTAATRYLSPLGPLTLAAAAGGLCLCRWGEEPAGAAVAVTGPDTDILREAVCQLDEYFGGRRQTFTVPLHPVGTPFQQSVWHELRAVAYGSTVSYAELARRIGRPGAQRAVAGALHRNPLSIFLPCHRVIQADGGLGGYAGGVEQKRRLLGMEASEP